MESPDLSTRRSSKSPNGELDLSCISAHDVLIVPGLRDHVAEHWQTHLEHELPRAISVPRKSADATDRLSCHAWVAALNQSIEQLARPVVLVAHSAGVAIVVHWAQRHRHGIKGALLVTPPDFSAPLPPGYPSFETFERNGWLPWPKRPLPFSSIVATSTNDPLGRFDRVAELAAHWGSSIVNLGNVGHLNPASGYGPWPGALPLIDELCRMPWAR